MLLLLFCMFLWYFFYQSYCLEMNFYIPNIIVANSQQAYIFIFEVLCCFKGSVKLFLMAAQVLEHKMAVSIKMCQLIELLWSDQMWFCLKPEEDRKLSNWTCNSSVHLNAFSLPALCFDYCLSFTTFDTLILTLLSFNSSSENLPHLS